MFLAYSPFFDHAIPRSSRNNNNKTADPRGWLDAVADGDICIGYAIEVTQSRDKFPVRQFGRRCFLDDGNRARCNSIHNFASCHEASSFD